MFDKPNPLRAKLSAGSAVVGCAVVSWSPIPVEVAASAGLDFVRIDCEHAWRRDEMIENMVRAAWLGGSTPLVRIEKGDQFLVRRAMEIGAGALLVSDIRSVEEARAVVRAARFPPLGERGFSGNCFSGGWGNHPSERWIEWSNKEPMIGVMIEHPDAVAALDDILAVPGLDFVYFGPGDYSVSIGLRKTARDDPRVSEAFQKTITSARKAGLHALGNPGTDPAQMKRLLDLGVDMLELGSDISLLSEHWRRAGAAARGNPEYFKSTKE